jgi:hypothetical protein
VSLFLVVWWVVIWRIISFLFPFIFSIFIPLVLSYLLDKGLVLSCLLNKGSIHSSEWFRTCVMGLMIFFIKSSLFCSSIRRHEICSEYLLKLRSLYCCCKIIFEAWKVKNVLFNI